jgi:pyrroline-5-carboxylate reductase
MKLGFVGTGTITASIVRGLGKDFSGSIHLSPRNAAVAADLAKRFAHVRIAASNQAVLDASDVVFLAVRPQIAKDVLAALTFRPDHHVISLIATASLETLSQRVAPAKRVTKAVPLPSVALGCGPTAIYPPDPVAADIFARMGQAIEVQTAEIFDALTAATATMASYFAFADAVASWLVQKGLPQHSARQYVAAIFEGLSLTAARAPDTDFLALADDHATKGGLNEQLRTHLTDKGAFGATQAGLEEILKRIQTAMPG